MDRRAPPRQSGYRLPLRHSMLPAASVVALPLPPLLFAPLVASPPVLALLIPHHTPPRWTPKRKRQPTRVRLEYLENIPCRTSRSHAPFSVPSRYMPYSWIQRSLDPACY